MECLTDPELFDLAKAAAVAMSYYFQGTVAMVLISGGTPENPEYLDVIFNYIPQLGVYCTGSAG